MATNDITFLNSDDEAEIDKSISNTNDRQRYGNKRNRGGSDDYVQMQITGDFVTPYATLTIEEPVLDTTSPVSPCHSSHDATNADNVPIPPPRPDGSVTHSVHRHRLASTRALSPVPESVDTSNQLSLSPSNLTVEPRRHAGRSLSPIRIFDHSKLDFGKVDTQSNDHRHILIRGIPANMAIEEFGKYLDKEILMTEDGFEDITIDRTHKEAVVTLKDTEATKEFLQIDESGKIFVLKNNEVKVLPYQKAPLDTKKLFIHGLTDDITNDGISNYIGKMCRMRPSIIFKGRRPDIALLCFEDSPVKDLSRVQSPFARNSMETTKFEVSPVEKTKRIKLISSSMETSSESLTRYFEENKLSKNGTVVSIIDRDNFKDYIVTFETFEDAERIVKQGEVIVNGVPLQSSFYYPCLDGDDDYIIKIPGPSKLHSHKYMCRFLKNTSQYRKDLEEMVSGHYGKTIWPDDKKDDSLCIQCIVDENDRLGRDKVKDWEQNATAVVFDICNFLSVNFEYFAQEISSALKSELKKMGISDPESILVSIEENRVVIAGDRKHVSEFSEIMKAKISSLEQDLDDRGHTVTKIVNLKRHEAELLKETVFLERLKNVNVSIKKQNVILKGKRILVNKSILEVEDIISGLPKQNIEGLGTLERSLLRTMETTLYIQNKMSESKLTGVWTSLDDGAIVMFSKSSEEVKLAVSILKSALKSSRIEVKVGKCMQRGVGKAFLKQIEAEYKGKAKLKATKEEVCIVSLDYLVEEITVKVRKYLDLHSVVTEVLPLDPGIFRYICSYKRNAIDSIEKQYRPMAVEIDYIDKRTRKGFMICGEKHKCKLAIVELHALVDTITRTDYGVNWPKFDEFLRTSTGINELTKIELAEKCVIRISTDNATAISEKQENNVLAECRIGNCKIEILEHDITEKESDFIVNPTDSTMNYKHGLGRTFVDKGGFSIQKDCIDYILSTPSFKNGEIFVGTAGCLPCRGIIHVAVPVWGGGNGNEESYLYHAVIQCLIEANRRNSVSVAFPTIGAGRFGYPCKTIAEVMMKAVKTFLVDNGTETSLRHVYICDIDRDVLELHVRAIEEGFGQISVMKPGEDDIDSSVPEKQGDCSNLIIKELVTGSLASQDSYFQTDVIANSTNSHLFLHLTSVSKSLVEKGGLEIVSDLKKKYPNGIDVGEIAESSGGNLKCNALLHGVLQKWDKGQGHADTVMGCFIHNCLLLAHKKQYVSVAFPVLGSGALEFPPERVAKIMFKAIDSFEKEMPCSSVKLVRVVIPPEDKESLKAFEEYKSKCDEVIQRSRLSEISSRQSCQVGSVFTESVGTDYTTTINHVTLSIEQGDLTKATTAVIINSVPEDLNLDSGIISRAILKAAGMSIQLEAKKDKKSFKQSGLVMTTSGQLLCQKIIHIKARNGLTGWKSSIMKCLAEVEKSCLNSVAFPPLGTGCKGFSPAEMAKVMVEGFQDYINGDGYKGHLRHVKVLIYETEKVDVFRRVVKSALENDSRKSIFQKFWDRKSADESECTRMVFHVYTESPESYTKVVRRIEDLHKEVNMPLPEAIASNMQDLQVYRLKRIGQTHGVHVTVSNTGITLSGYEKNIEIVRRKIQQEIEH